MTGSQPAKVAIQSGSPIAEDANGNAFPATESATAFAVAMDGVAAGGIVHYTTDEIVSRSDWTAIAGTKSLMPGTAYFVSGIGMLSTSGQQQVGVAQSGTKLRVNIGQNFAPTTTIYTIAGLPSLTLGKIGDYAIQPSLLRIFGPKSASGWPAPMYWSPFPITHS